MWLLNLLSPRARKRCLWSLGLLLAYTVLGFLVLPPIVRAIAVKQLSQQLERPVFLQQVKLNPFVLSATLRGLLIKDKDGQPFVSWDEVYVNLQLSSFLGHPWVFQEVSTVRPYVRVQVNKDNSFNFSDLLTKFSTNTASSGASKPLALRIDRLRIQGASASLTDLTPRTPFARTLGPIDVTLVNFRTDPDNKNPYSVAGTTDAGEQFSWAGYFYLNPLTSQGDFSLQNLKLDKYAPLYQDFVRFRVNQGTVGLQTSYHFELSASNRVAWVTNLAVNLRSLRVAESANGPDLVSLPEFTITGVSANTQTRQAEVGSVLATGARISLRRDQDRGINVLEAAKPSEPGAGVPGGVLLLLRGVTNAVHLLLSSTNAWAGTVHHVAVRDCALNLADLATARPVRLGLDQIQLAATNISNLPGSQFSAALSLRWNTNGTIKSDVHAAFFPLTADVHLTLDRLELKPLDPYLEPKLNVFILGSKLGMEGNVRLRQEPAQLPDVTFQGDVRLDDFSTVDGLLAEDLVKWKSVRVSGIAAKLNSQEVAIKEVAVDDLYARAIVQTNHTINLMTALHLDAETNAAPAQTTPAPAPSKAVESISTPAAIVKEFALPKVAVASVVISNAEVRFTDRSVSPSVNVSVQKAGGTITGLSSEALGRADLALHASVDNVGPVEVTGKLNLLSLRPGPGAPVPGTNEITIAVRNVDLTPTSPYVGRFAGYRLLQGKLGMDLHYVITNRKLQSQNQIVLDRFTFGDKVNSPDATKLPVRLAVAILKDREGKIRLDVPIEGSLEDPQFRLHKVIVHAIGNILTKIATSPFAALGAVFGGHGEELSYQDFAPGSTVVQNPEKLNSLAKGLYERPGLQLEIAGSVEPAADRDGLRRAALEKRLRTAKWMSLRKAQRESSSPDQITLTPEERLSWLKEVYAEAMAKGEITTNTAALAGSGTNTLNPAEILAELRPSTPERGATMLLQHTSSGAAAAKSAVAIAPAAARPSPSSSAEQLLADSIPVSDDDFRTLADARAKAVRAYLIQQGKVEPERIFLTENQTGSVKTQGSRALMQFR